MNAASPRPSEPLLHIAGLGKTFGGLRALEDIDLSVWPGEVVGLVGDNGAGKSTLVRCIAGIYSHDSGEILVGGASLGSGGPKRAAELGIEIVHQDLSLIMHGDVVQNLYLNREIRVKAPLLEQDRLARQGRHAGRGARHPRAGWHGRDGFGAPADPRSFRGSAAVRRDRAGGRLEPPHRVP